MNRREVFDDIRVVIIGAGIAGLSAAVMLHKSGVENLVILEAQPQPGGRIKSVDFGGGKVDLGAQWFHGTKNELCQIAEKNGFLRSTNSNEGLGNYYCDGNVVPANLVSDIACFVAKALTNLENLGYDKNIPESVGEYLTREFEFYTDSSHESDEVIAIKKQVFDWHLRFQVIDNACTDLWALSAKYFGNYKFCGGDDYVNLKYGYSSLIDHLVSQLTPGVLHTRCPVKIVRWKEKISSSSKNICEVITETGTIYRSDHVIVTCSVGFLKENLSMFHPPLPRRYLKGFNCIGFDTMNKIYLEYEQSWWDELKGIQLIWNSKERKKKLAKDPTLWTCDLTGFDPVVGLPNVLLGWVGGEGAVLMEKFPSNVIGLHCTYVLRDVTGHYEIPEPITCISSSWSSNKYIRGGYSHLNTNKRKYKSALASLSEPVYSYRLNSSQHPSILFAGEALHDTCYSTTHGAFESGKKQASKLLKIMNSSS